MPKILPYLLSDYQTTGNVFHTIVEVKNRFGWDILDELNGLFKAGWIRKRQYVNGFMIELLKFE